MKTVKVIVRTSVIIGGIYLIYKAVKKTNSVIDGVSEVKNKMNTFIQDQAINWMKDINKNLETKIKEKEDKLLNDKEKN